MDTQPSLGVPIPISKPKPMRKVLRYIAFSALYIYTGLAILIAGISIVGIIMDMDLPTKPATYGIYCVLIIAVVWGCYFVYRGASEFFGLLDMIIDKVATWRRVNRPK